MATAPDRNSFPRANAALFPREIPPIPPIRQVDLSTLNYVGSFDHNLVCAICRSPFVDPVSLNCEHVFCRRCVHDAMFHQDRDSRVYSLTCPSCRRKIDNRAVAAAPRILSCILDELNVKCPLEFEGCGEIRPRGEIQDHVDKYCAYAEVVCPSGNCILTVRRKDTQEQRCLHGVLKCEFCKEPVMERDLDTHRRQHCEMEKVSCPDCDAQVLYRDLEAHGKGCPDAIIPCSAAEYGCDFIARRISLDEHLKTCPLAKIVPFLKTQNDRLEAHEAALKQLRHKNSVLETSFSTIQDTLNASANLIDVPPPSTAGSDTGPFDSTVHHLLCLHESLREEVSRVSAAVSEVDAKASMMVMNERLRINEELAHTNGAIGGMRMQLHWLMSARLQNQQRVALVRAQSSGEGLGSSAGNDTGGLTGGDELPFRRMSDSMRQDPKL